MTTTSQTGETPVRTYTRLLLKLHALLAEGKGETEEADALREEMDAPWYAMGPQEQDRANRLSADLYALAEGGPKPAPMSSAERQRWGQNLQQSFQGGDWDRALELLRQPPPDVSSGTAAFLQARCWEGLGEPEVAQLFMRKAEPMNSESLPGVLAWLRELDRSSSE